MRRPICTLCRVEFRPLENGINVIDIFSQPPKPYRVTYADLFECPVCRNQIVSGFASKPWAEHHEDKFEYWLQKALEGTHVYNYEYATNALRSDSLKAEVLEP
ncbi:hypothetical protein ES703_68479 [subsurface metagenome]